MLSAPAAKVSPSTTSASKKSENSASKISGPSLDWRAFVAFTESKASKILAEYLKRLQVKQFASGMLVATAPVFTVQTLKKSDEQARLKTLLQEFSGSEGWVIELSESSATAGSMSEDAVERRETKQKSAEANLVQHPQVQALQALFPGSEIEHIDVASPFLEGDDL